MASTQVIVRQTNDKVTFDIRWATDKHQFRADDLYDCAASLRKGDGKSFLVTGEPDFLSVFNALLAISPNLLIPAEKGVFAMNYVEALRFVLIHASSVNFTFESSHYAGYEGSKPPVLWVRTEVHFFGDFSGMPEGARGERVNSDH